MNFKLKSQELTSIEPTQKKVKTEPVELKFSSKPLIPVPHAIGNKEIEEEAEVKKLLF
jgi:hypothetical protein